MTKLHGFELVRDERIEEINTQAQLWRHTKTGAELLSLINEDENKVFGVTLRTPPSDSTGIAHIMEHSVLCGSRKYPSKEPFVELIKGSLNTFLNAMTYPDKTCYPIASQNLQDFYNLMDVYLDAVFYPRIPPETLMQEGWHYELETAEGPMSYKGVVFNEMKGVFSSPDSVLGRYSFQMLYPDTPYGVESGGDPKAIPDLTYEQFKQFHASFYHPSNARIWLYGDDPPEERLRRMDEYLREFERIEVPSAIPLQPTWSEPKRVTRPYNVGEDGDASKKGMITVNWLLTESNNAQTNLALGILDYILIGTPAAPLRKALIDSGLGEDLAGGGLGDGLRQVYFSIGLKGIALDDADKVEQLVLDTFTLLADQGIDADTIAAAINTIEFRLRENNTGSYPRGLALMLRALDTWLYEGDPLEPLRFEAPLAAIKAAVDNGERPFETLIRTLLLENSHRITLVLEPDPQLAKRNEEQERARLDAAFSSMSAEERQRVVEETKRLHALQEAPDSPEALASIPSLKREDLDKNIKPIPIAVLQHSGSTILTHDLFTNGILYLDLGLNLRVLPAELLPYAGLFGRVLLEMGTTDEDFVKLAQRIGSSTGGIRPGALTTAVNGSRESQTWLFLRSKTTLEKTDELLSILHDVLTKGKLDDRERFKQIVLEEKAGEESGLIPGGHVVVKSRLSSRFTVSDWAAEQMGGISYLFFLRKLAEQIDSDWPSVLGALERVRSLLVNRNAMLANVTLDAENYRAVEPKLTALLEAFPAVAVDIATWAPEDGPRYEGLTIPAQVNYVGKGANLYELGYSYNGASAVALKYLRTSFLWEKIRVQGGAYGGFATFDRRSGVFNYLSYRDPNLLGTLNNYDNAARFLLESPLPEEEVTKSVVGTIGDLDGYQLPDAKGYTSMVFYLTGDTDETRQRIRDEVLNTSMEDFRAFGEVLEKVVEQGQVAVLGSAQAIEGASKELGSTFEVTKVL